MRDHGERPRLLDRPRQQEAEFAVAGKEVVRLREDVVAALTLEVVAAK